MRNTICVKCQEEYRPLKNNVLVVFSVNDESDVMHFADLWICPKCGSKIIQGFGSDAVCYAFEEGWDKYLENSTYQKIYINLKKG